MDEVEMVKIFSKIRFYPQNGNDIDVYLITSLERVRRKRYEKNKDMNLPKEDTTVEGHKTFLPALEKMAKKNYAIYPSFLKQCLS